MNDAPTTSPFDTLKIRKIKGRAVGGVWVLGTIADHDFEALVFPEHAESESFELDQSRISKLWLRDRQTGQAVASFERGWDLKPATATAAALVGLLSAGLAEHVFGS